MFKETITKATEVVSKVQQVIDDAISSAKESYRKAAEQRRSQEGKENPEELLDLVKSYGGLIGMVDAGIYISNIEKDPINAEVPDFLAKVFKQFPEVEERFKKFIEENKK